MMIPLLIRFSLELILLLYKYKETHLSYAERMFVFLCNCCWLVFFTMYYFAIILFQMMKSQLLDMRIA